MKFMVKLGVVNGNYGAIHSATSVAAKINRLEKKLGTLEAGKLADVIVVEGNPSEDLDALEHVKMTFVTGKRLV
jgi:imidazolonepropionase-like amidohydrolase